MDINIQDNQDNNILNELKYNDLPPEQPELVITNSMLFDKMDIIGHFPIERKAADYPPMIKKIKNPPFKHKIREKRPKPEHIEPPVPPVASLPYDYKELIINGKFYDCTNRFYVNRDHVNFNIIEAYSEMKTLDIPSTNLSNMLDDMLVTEEQLCMWIGYCGGRLFHDKNTMKSMLETLITYAEESALTSPGIKQKLRFVTQLLTDDPSFDKFGVIALLASHGNVCNVMKEVGIQQAYALMTNSSQENNMRSTFDQALLRCLRLLRESCMEDTYTKSKYCNKCNTYKVINTHNYIGYANVFAPHVGLLITPDPNVININADCLDLDLFFSQYTPDRIIKFVMTAINEKPRKISYQTSVNWYQANSLDGVDPYEFLSCVFDMESGKVKQEWVEYMLCKLGIFEYDAEVVNWSSIYIASSVDEELFESKTEISVTSELPPPSLPLKMQKSISENASMPAMVRQLSKEEENAEDDFILNLCRFASHLKIEKESIESKKVTKFYS